MDEPTRQTMTFAQAEGVHPLPNQLNLGEMSQQLISFLWAGIHPHLERCKEVRAHWEGDIVKDYMWSIYRSYRLTIFHDYIDEISQSYESVFEDIKGIITSGNYIATFNFLQFMLRHPDRPPMFAEWLTRTLNGCLAAYRVQGRTIIPISDEYQFNAVSKTFTELKYTEFNGARAHLEEAAIALNQRQFANSISESVKAVESIVRMLSDENTLGKALTNLKGKIQIHPALEKGILNIYGYTSDQQGLRHALLEKNAAEVDEIDALFMFSSCCSFVSYLVGRGRQAGLVS